MKNIPQKTIYVTALLLTGVLTGVICFEIANIRAKRTLYRQDLDTRIVNVNISLDTLKLLRKQEYSKAISVLETAMLAETLGLADDEKVLGRNEDIQGITKTMSEYCAANNVFDGKTNLPSHYLAKRFLDSHADK